MQIIQTVLALALTLGILVTLHEYGHFWVARRFGVKVLRFSVGFGKPLFSWYDRHGTEYAVAAIPLGGYVKMLDEPPFTNQLYHDAFMIETKQRLDVLKDSIQGSGIDTCLKQHQKAVDQRPDDWALHWRYAVLLGSRYPEDLKAQEQQLREVLQCCPYDAAYLALARNLHRQGTVTEAIALLYDLLKLTPNAGRAHVELASIYRKLRNDEKYIEHLSKSLTIDPTSSIEAYGALAEAYDKTGQPHKAIETLYKATRHFPEAQTAPVHASLGYLLNTQGKPEKALEELKLALKINPDFTNDRLFKSLLTELEAKANQ